MGTLRYTGKRDRGSERGFTLAEVMVTIVIMGVLAGIAIPSWWSVVESRRVDTAANQVVADLRLAHSKASSRLTTQRIVITAPLANPNTYQIGPTGFLETRTLPDGTRISTSTTIEIAFCADGSDEAPPSGSVCPGGSATPTPVFGPTDTTTIIVASSDGNPCTNIEVNKVTSRVIRASATTCP